MEAVLASCGNGFRLSTQRDQSRALDEQCAIVVPSNHRRSLYKRLGHADEKGATLLSSVCSSQSSSTEGPRGHYTSGRRGRREQARGNGSRRERKRRRPFAG